MSKKVLIFTYYWPPAGGVAVQRWLKFAKYLPEFGWEPIIVTVENGSYPYYDESLLQEVSPSLRVYRTKTFEPFELYNLLRGQTGKAVPTQSITDTSNKSFFQKLSEYIRANLFIPDARKGWVKYAVKQAENILKAEKIDAIVTSGPPHSTHLIGLELKRKFPIKWLADFRDPWTEIFYNKFLPRTEAAKQKDHQLESAVLQTADCAIAIGNGISNMLKSKSKRTEVLLNGFDLHDTADFEGTVNNEKFTIGHVGTYIASLNSEGLWKAIKALKAEHEDFIKDCRFLFTGRVDASIMAKMKSYDILDLMEFDDFIPHKQAVKRMHDADLLLLVFANVPNNQYIVSGRLFEYLASGSEVLAIGPVGGDADVILTAMNGTPVMGYDDEPAIKQRLLNSYTAWKNNQHVSTKMDLQRMNQYQRREITQRLALLLNEVTSAS